ncbi:laminin subunit beta-1-like isoform X1 [Sphaerodactylus townsendi]|uniref:laminin subunit beta-1-like isoform X1 n=2 Tax=Sphaerodactylus townsendi TaxID=933632 RepID=UPI0020270489|nr:laminin subunit beta-1-like isoform X1 [Sphaerodactylus townsendi]
MHRLKLRILPMALLLYLLLWVQVADAQGPEEPDLLYHGCSEGSCYPATGNLLIGRSHSLSATSTCGLEEHQEYCIVSHLQDSEKCFTCDSRSPSLRESHRIENVIYLSGQDGEQTWWQSENGVEEVSIRLDLEAEFHFTHLIMKFKTFRPAAMLIERSSDFGHTWKVYRYFAFNCSKLFPGVPTQIPTHVNQAVCDQRYSEIEPSSHGEVIFKVLDPAVKVEDPYSREIQDLLRVTNLRVNFTKLHTLGDNLLDSRHQVLQKYYYAVYEMVLRGSCFCYGHASECAPLAGVSSRVEGMIHGRCVCKHHTKGLNCELCKDFYQELPWRPAEAYNPHACQECNCNEHSHKCHFDMAVYLATGNTSGGVCNDCQHNTMGRHCQICKPFYYRNPLADIRASSACIPCDCDPVGSLDGGVCDSHTDAMLGMIAGQCRCKENVKGMRCDSCKEAFYGLSRNDPQGCQPCRCDPRGIIAGSSPCDHISGDCYCKRFVTGRYCNQCLPEYWGLSYDMAGCRSCACDFGGAYSNRCSTDDGQCPCRANLMGRQCSEVQPGFFCMPLDYYMYEAEHAMGHPPTHHGLPGALRPEAPVDCVEYYNGVQNGRKVRLRRQHSTARLLQQRAALRRARQLQQKPDVEVVQREHTGHMITWTGPGFARVRDGAGLSFQIDNIPYAMEYDILLRYEPESTEDWEAVVSVSSQALPMSPRCGNVLPSEQKYQESLPHSSRYVLLPRPFCFEPRNRYEIIVRFQRAGVTQRYPAAFILVDSLVLLPRVMELPGLDGNDPVSVERREELERYTCLEVFRMATMPDLAEMCARLLCSISALMHDGALPCQCDPQGSTSSVCHKLGGQCQCKPNVVGRRCDQCAPGTYGFGPYGCIPCACSLEGSVSKICEPVSGQCQCQHGTVGRQCDQCPPGQWGFPSCRPCHCNGHSEECDSHTGTCHQCRDYTAGRHCERCLDGYYGDPILGSGQQCRPCPCPGYPGSRHYHGISCHTDRETNQIVCLCAPGYTGPRCDSCAPGYFGAPEQESGACRPCQCNNNIDTSDPEACDPHTGQCLRCLYHTGGPHCAECQPGYYGNAFQRNCRRCTCNEQGTLPSHCPEGICHCDRMTGSCPCRANVVDKNCDKCAANFWGFGSELGCQPCNCDPAHSLRSDCNLFTGQCHCQPGFGGRVCSHCQENHWGDPEQECLACECNPTGSESLQCDHLRGHCRCREGFTGRRCDQCQRGFRQNFPRCSACHPCFGLWDEVLRKLWAQVGRLQETVQALKEGGPITEASNSRIRSLERSLDQAQELLGDGSSPSSSLLPHLSSLLAQLRADMDDLWQQLQTTDSHLGGTEQDAAGQRSRLNALNRELGMLNRTVGHLRNQLDTIAGANFNESFHSIVGYFQMSEQAQLQAEASVQGAQSPVGQSKHTHQSTVELLKLRGNTFRRTAAAHRKSLRDLKKNVSSLHLHRINQKICGGSGEEDCQRAPCGGANCKDSSGQPHCGGPGCTGALPVSMRALNTAQNISRQLEATNRQLGTIASKVQEIQDLARDTRNRAQETLDRAQVARSRTENSTARLREFIQKIKDFLAEEGADPESIELVAQQVLDISLPISPTEIGSLLQEIRNTISQLDGVDVILNSTVGDLARARDLLAEAEQAKERAEGVQATITDTRAALNDAKHKVRAADRAMDSTREVIRNVEGRVAEAEQKLQAVVSKASQLESRLGELAQDVATLQEKSQSNQRLAQQAKGKAERATAVAGRLSKEVEKVMQKYQELQKQLEGQPGGGDSLQRLMSLKMEAQKLLDKANSSKRKVEELEERFEANEKEMQAKATKLQTLEKKVTELLNYIREKATAYATC